MARLLFVTGSLSHGGAEKLSVAMMNRLAGRGHDCHAVYVKAGAPGLLPHIRLPAGATVHCLDAARYLDLRALADFAALLARLRPSAIIAANAYALMYASLARLKARWHGPLMVTYHSTRLFGAKERLQMALYRLFFWSADCLVFVCEAQRRYCLRRGLWSRRHEVIYNGVDTDAFSAARSPAERAAFGWRESDYVIGLTAVLRPEKNPVQLVEAVGLLRARGIPARALFIGDGPLRGAVQAQARALGIEASVRVTGMQQDVRPLVAACDVAALCSRTEAFSLAAIEAMALGKPVVHAEVGGAGEMVFPGSNGYLFPPGDTSSFVDRLARLADRAVSRRMGERAREAAVLLFSEANMIDRYERILRELCSQDGPHPTGSSAPRGGDIERRNNQRQST
ncbi:MAG TPA: glycosyltransferase family 4 protein [Burkholderiales bacterium]